MGGQTGAGIKQQRGLGRAEVWFFFFQVFDMVCARINAVLESQHAGTVSPDGLMQTGTATKICSMSQKPSLNRNHRTGSMYALRSCCYGLAWAQSDSPCLIVSYHSSHNVAAIATTYIPQPFTSDETLQ
jgi:hypothetical protein